MLKYPCLVLDHDDTVVQSERTVNYPFFAQILDEFRPGQTISELSYVKGCFEPGFIEMCREQFHFTDEELSIEYKRWQAYVRTHAASPFPGIAQIIQRQKSLGGTVCVVTQSAEEIVSRDYELHFGIQPDAIYSWDLPAHQRKPSPYALEHIMQTFGYSPAELLVVDDMKPACDMARKANTSIAFAAWSKTEIPQILQEMTELCDFTFHSPQELEDFLFN